MVETAICQEYAHVFLDGLVMNVYKVWNEILHSLDIRELN